MSYTGNITKSNESFDCNNFPVLVEAIRKIRSNTSELPNDFKEEIVISFAKDHCLNMIWIIANPQISTLITSGALPIHSLETLFAVYRDNRSFISQLENYIRTSLKA